MRMHKSSLLKKELSILLAFALLVGSFAFIAQPLRANAVTYGTWRFYTSTRSNNTSNGFDQGTYDPVTIKIWSGPNGTGDLIYESPDLGNGHMNGGNSGSMTVNNVPTSNQIVSITVGKTSGSDGWGVDTVAAYYTPLGASEQLIASVRFDAMWDNNDNHVLYSGNWFTVTHNRAVTFYGNGATGGSTATKYILWGTVDNLTPNGYVRLGYSFLGWATSPDGELAYANGQEITMTDNNLDLFALWTPYTYRVAYNGNGATGGIMAQSEFTYGQASNLSLNTFTRTGFTFDGWATSPGGSAVYSDGQSVINLTSVNMQTVTLYATWAPLSHTLTYDGNGATGGSMSPHSIIEGATDTLHLNQYTRTGYTFAGWALNPGGSALYIDGDNYTMGTANATIYAKWNPIVYTISYNGNGATSGMTVNSTHSYDVAKTLNNNGYSRTGYSFLGWATSSSATVPQYANQQSVVNLTNVAGTVITFYAVWTPSTYNLVFNANGGIGTMANQPIVYLQSASIRLNTFTMIGRSFAGWATSQANAEAGIVAYANGATYNMSTPESKILYAVWTPNTYTLNYYPNATGVTGSMSSQNMVFGQTYTLNSNAFAKTGYGFIGWAETPGGIKAYDNGATYTLNTEGASLYAKWQANTYQVNYNANGGTSAPSPTAEPVLAGYTFVGWSTSPAADVAEYIAGESVINLTASNGATVTLYAVWMAGNQSTYSVNHYHETVTGTYELYETTLQVGTTGEIGTGIYRTYAGFTANMSHPSTVSYGTIVGGGTLTLMLFYNRRTYTISFNTAGGSSISPISGKMGAPYTPPANPTKAGFTFSHWNPALPETIPMYNFTTTAVWTTNYYELVFNGNGATGGTMPGQMINYNATVNLNVNTYVRDGYNFAGWSTTSTGTKMYDDGASFTMNTTGATLYALWTPGTASFSVQHYLQDVGADTYSFGYSTTQTGTTGNVGIAQWETIAGFTANYGYAGNVTAGVIEGGGGLILKLYYTRNSYTLSFSGADGMAPINAQYGQEIAQPATPVKTGFDFAGWYFDSGLTQLVTWPYSMGAANRTLYAKWELAKFTVTFNPVGGKINGTTGLKYSTVTLQSTYAEGTLGFPTPEKTGYTFAGWFDGATQYFGSTVVALTANQTLTAAWTVNQGSVSYNLNGAEGTPPADVFGDFGTAVPLPTAEYANLRTGYSLLGWNTSQYATTALASYTIPDGHETLYAVWQINQYTVSYSLNGGSGTAPATFSANYGTAVNVSQTGYTRTGYTFSGWGLSPNATAAQKLTSFNVPAYDVTLYAIWTGNAHTITLFANGGTGATVQISTNVGTMVNLTPYNNFSKAGMVLVGFNTSSTATTGFWSYLVPATSTTLLFAIYQPKPEVTITFNLNGGTGTVPAAQVGLPGNAATLPAQGDISRQFYTFLGWAETAGAAAPLAGYNYPNADATLYAVWQRVPVTLAKRTGSTTVFAAEAGVNYIYGLEEGLSEQAFRNQFVLVGGDGRLQITKVDGSFGTGTRVDLYDNVTNALLKTYWVVIFGDVDGDGYVTAADENLIDAAASYQSEFEYGTAAFYAADIMQDGGVDALDLNIVSAATSYTGVLDQANPGVII